MWIITCFAFLVCNQGLNVILSISVPILNAIYPVAIVLILLGLSHPLWAGKPLVYPLAVAGTGCVSVVYALDQLGLSLGAVGRVFRVLPFYAEGFGWAGVFAVMLALALAVSALRKKAA